MCHDPVLNGFWDLVRFHQFKDGADIHGHAEVQDLFVGAEVGTVEVAATGNGEGGEAGLAASVDDPGSEVGEVFTTPHEEGVSEGEVGALAEEAAEAGLQFGGGGHGGGGPGKGSVQPAGLQVGGCMKDAEGGFLHVGVDLGGFSPNLKLHMGMITDDVAAVLGQEGADVDAGEAGRVTGNGVEIEDGGGRGQEGVVSLLGAGSGMGCGAKEVGVDFRAGEKAIKTGTHKGLAGGGGHDVGAQKVVHVIEMTMEDDGTGTTKAFFRGLKEEEKGAMEGLSAGSQEGGGTQSDGHVGIMATGVHGSREAGGEAGLSGEVGTVGFFPNGEGVQVKAEADGGTGTAVEDSDHAGVAIFGRGEEFGIGTMILCPSVVGIHHFRAGKAHAGLTEADIPSQENLVKVEVMEFAGDEG